MNNTHINYKYKKYKNKYLDKSKMSGGGLPLTDEVMEIMDNDFEFMNNTHINYKYKKYKNKYLNKIKMLAGGLPLTDEVMEIIDNDFEFMNNYHKKDWYKNMKNTLNFVNQFLGAPYSCLCGSDPGRDGLPSPFYYLLDISKVPELTIKTVRESGISCTGVINLMRKFNNKDLPSGDFPGGTKEWHEYILACNDRKDIDCNIYNFHIKYDQCEEKNINPPLPECVVNKNNFLLLPIGTLLARKYRDTNDPGHVAVVADLVLTKQDSSDKKYKNMIIHSYTSSQVCTYARELSPPGFVFEDLDESNSWNRIKDKEERYNYYDYFILPHQWINMQLNN